MLIKYLAVFFLGFITSSLFFYSYIGLDLEFPISGDFYSADLSAPGNWVDFDNVLLFDDRVVIKIENASLSKYAATGSMIPIFDENANGIRIVPEDEDSINVGDIITFEKNDLLIVHRVIEIGIDSEGKYFITKGDNNLVADVKIRFEDIRYVTIGVIW